MQRQYFSKASKLRHWRIAALVAVFALVIGLSLYWWGLGLIDFAKYDTGGYRELDSKALGNFDFDQRDGKFQEIPARFRNLDGKKVLLTGEMWAPSTAVDASLSYFQLCGEIQSSSFQPPLVQRFVNCTVPPGQKAFFYSGAVQVWGVFHVKIYKDNGSGVINSIYQLDVEKVKPIN